MWKVVIASGTCILIFFGAAFVLKNKNSVVREEKIGVVMVGTLRVPVSVADTPLLRAQGLSGRKALRQNSGMLFLMESAGLHGIWMKEMYFPIDIIWIDDFLYIVTITADASPDSYPLVFYPNSPAKYVLEVNAGFAHEHGISVGGRVSFERALSE